MSKPTINPAWSMNNDPLDNIEPEEAFKLGGVQSGNPWARENLNWQFYALAQWIEWVKNDASDRTLNLSDLTDKPQALTHLGLQNPATLIKAATEGNAGSATKLLNKRKINGVDFDGTSDITITANPNSHTHGAITNDGKIGTDANLPIITGTGGVLKAGAFGSDANTFTQGNDSRLSNSREWTASTISQAEAEAGAATTRRAFTAQRLRQGIVAWFNGISGALGRTILSRTMAAEVRDDIGLGSAATRDVGTDNGNVMQVGAFGLGGSGIVVDNGDDLNNQSKFHKFAAWYSTLAPKNGWANAIYLTLRGNNNRYAQIGFGETTDDFRIRCGSTISTAGSWKQVTHTGNLWSAINTMGNMNVNGSITATGNITAYSDLSLKENLTIIDNPISKVKSLTGYTYDRKDIETPRQTGLIAQDVQKVLPEAIVENEDGLLSLAYGNMVGLLVEAIKEQQTQIDNLKKEIELIRRG